MCVSVLVPVPIIVLMIIYIINKAIGYVFIEYLVCDKLHFVQVTEHVTIELGGPSFFQALMSSDEMTQLIKKEELFLIKGNNNSYAISGNWKSVQNFRESFQQFMINELKKCTREDFSGLFSSTSETTESSIHPKPEATEDPKPESADNASSDGHISAKGSSLNPDVLALMQKTGVYQHPALSYDLQTATINVECDDPTEKEKIKEELFSAYRELMMGGKLKEYAFPVDDIQQASTLVDECAKAFNHTYFRYDTEKKEIKCLSTDARQMQNVRRRLNSMKKDPKVKSVFIDLPKKSRRVTIKLGDIIEEEVDVIVNAANDRLMHAGGVAAAIDKASYGAVQRESSKVIGQSGTLSTGEAVITNAGGKLKCKFVVHAVGPIASLHKDQCGTLLHNACVNSMVMAQRNKAKSVSFPPISSGIFGVSKELVANVMLSSLCSYTCSDPDLLNDVRIVIIDEPTFDVFLKFFHKERGNLESLQHTKLATTSKSTTYQHSMKVGNSSQLGGPKSFTKVSIDLPKLARRVTLKLDDIVQEQVDAIVNAANIHLLHLGGVAEAINKASDGAVQRECSKIIHSAKLIPTGDAVATTAGGTLKCKIVIHAVGPTASQHLDQCGSLLQKACISALNIAQNFEAISIAFPPISSGHCGVSTELVASVMLSTLCSYKCSSPALLNDVRVVIIDKPTFEVFLKVFHKEQQNLYNNTTTIPEILKPATFQYGQSTGNLFSSDNATKFPGHAQPVLYSQAVIKQPLEMKNFTSGNPQPTNPSQPNNQDYHQAMSGTSSDTSFNTNKHAEPLPVTSEPKDDPTDPGSAQGDIISHPSQARRVVSSNATNGSTNTDEESIKNLESIDDDDNTKVKKHGEDIPIDSFKESSNEENKENIGSNDSVFDKPTGYDSSVDPDSTNPNMKPPPDNANPSLQPALANPLDHTKNLEETSDEDPNPEASQDSASLAPKKNQVSITLYSKHLPPSATDGGQMSLQKSERKGKNKGKKEDKNGKTKGKIYVTSSVS